MFKTWPVGIFIKITLLLCISVAGKAQNDVFLYTSNSNNFSPYNLSYFIDSGNKLGYEDYGY